ncbi:hypothetical protein RQN30_07010 [Arcanobacterium hippocoleae]
MGHPELQDELSPLAQMAQTASRRIRPMILNLDSRESHPSLDEAISMSATMLTTRNITLNVEADTFLDQRLDRHSIILASLFIREAAANALKYAPDSSTVDLIVEEDSRILRLTMRNDIIKRDHISGITGGFGLVNLQQRFQSSGAELTFFGDNDEWIIIAAIAQGEEL